MTVEMVAKPGHRLFPHPLLAGLFLAYAALYYAAQLPDLRHSGDFAALWSYGQVLHAEGAAALYDPARLQALQLALGMPAGQRNPFPYPPGFLPIVWPLGLLGFGAALIAWTGVTLGAFLLACRGRLAWVALIAPGTTIEIIAGQTGLLSGALFLGGMRLVGTRPWLGGVLLGLLTFKPQLGVLIPVALLALRAWRAIGGALLSSAGLLLAGVALFGIDTGALWLGALPAYATEFADRSVRYGMMPTTLANLSMLGMPHGVALGLQGVAAAGAAVLVWRAFRRAGQCGPRELLILAAATFLATPHAFVYDLPLLTGAALVYGVGGRGGVTALVLVLPAAMLWSGPLPLSTPVLAGVLAVLIGLRRGAAPSSGTPRRFSTV